MTKTKTKLKDHLMTIACGTLITYLAFSLSFFLILNDKGFYDRTFAEYGAYAQMGVEGTRSTVDYLINYLTSENSDIKKAGLSVFTESEQSHLEDVHYLVQIIKYGTFISIILLAGLLARVYLKDNFRKKIKEIMKYSSIKILVTLFLGLILSINFDWFFEIFHKIFFPQGNYSFPSDYLLIILFPTSFFQDFFIKIMIYVLIFAAMLYVAGKTDWLIEDKNSKKKK